MSRAGEIKKRIDQLDVLMRSWAERGSTDDKADEMIRKFEEEKDRLLKELEEIKAREAKDLDDR